jgi:HK97 family phage major capsid protein
MTVRELREKRAALVAEAQKLIPTDGTAMSAENRTKFDTMMEDADGLKETISRMERASSSDAEIRSHTAPVAGTPEVRDDKVMTKEQRSAFGKYLRDGSTVVSAEFRDLGISPSQLGGYFVPQGFVYDVEVATKAYGNLLQNIGELVTATGQPLPYPTSIDIGVNDSPPSENWNMAYILGEGQQADEIDLNLGHIMFGAYKYTTGLVKVSLELLQDSAFNLEDFLKDQFAVRLARGWTSDLTNGQGSTESEPNGILTAATDSTVVCAGSSSNDGIDTNTGVNSIGTDDLTDLIYSLDPSYRLGAKFVMHDTTVGFLKKIKDKFGRPLWLPGIASNAPDTILGYPYVIDQFMPVIASGAKTVLFGELKKYVQRRVRELAILVLKERFADYGQTAFIGFARADGNLVDAGMHPVKYLTQDTK